MGTNYYWHPSGERECPHCKQPTPNLHVGKSSAGWCFSLRIHPHKGIDNLDDWKRVWSSGLTVDEYDSPVSVAKMLAIITGRVWEGMAWTPATLESNSARPGPNGLARHADSGAVPGDGTYDLCDYEFS